MIPEEDVSGEVHTGRRVATRREELLGELRPVVVQRGRRRRILVAAGRTGALAIAVAAIVGGVKAMSGGTPGSPVVNSPSEHSPAQPVHIVVKQTPSPAVAAAPAVRIEFLQTRVGISKAVEVVPGTAVKRASDDELITALYDTGQEPELVRVGGRVVVAGNLGRQ